MRPIALRSISELNLYINHPLSADQIQFSPTSVQRTHICFTAFCLALRASTVLLHNHTEASQIFINAEAAYDPFTHPKLMLKSAGIHPAGLYFRHLSQITGVHLFQVLHNNDLPQICWRSGAGAGALAGCGRLGACGRYPLRVLPLPGSLDQSPAGGSPFFRSQILVLNSRAVRVVYVGAACLVRRCAMVAAAAAGQDAQGGLRADL